MLPNILTIADEHGLQCVERTRRKKEVYFRCPFCHHHNPKLSLNPAKNVFKCWHCGESGGVLDFEAKLTGKSFTEVKTAYFPHSRKKSLNAKQRKKIGWQEFKQESKEQYQESVQTMKADWQAYQYFMCRKYFAYLSVISLIDDQKRRNQLIAWWYDEVRKTEIPSLASTLLGGFTEHSPWQQEGDTVAQMAFEVCKTTGDFELLDIVKNTAFLLFYVVQEETEMWQRGEVTTKFGHPLLLQNLKEARFYL